MVLDTSVVYDILTRKPGYQRYLEALESDQERAMSAATLYEAAVVLYCERRNHTLVDLLKEFIVTARIEIIPFDTDSAWQAMDAYARFGKGMHPARLNLLDCVTYQLANNSGRRLLFKGEDFSRTDIRSAL